MDTQATTRTERGPSTTLVAGGALAVAAMFGVAAAFGQAPRVVGLAALVLAPLLFGWRLRSRPSPSIAELTSIAIWAYSVPVATDLLWTGDWDPVRGVLAGAAIVGALLSAFPRPLHDGYATPTVAAGAAGRLRALALALVVFGSTVFFAFLIAGWEGTRESLFAAEAGSNLGPLSIGTHVLLTGLVVAALCDLGLTERISPLVWIVGICYIALNLAIGDRGQVLVLPIAYLMLRRPFHTSAGTMARLAVIGVLPFMFVTDLSRSYTEGGVRSELRNGAFGVPYYVLRDIDARVDVRNSAPSVWTRLDAWIPRALHQGERGEALPEWYTRVLYPGYRVDGESSGRGFSVYGEARLYLPLGAVLVVPVLWMGLARLLDRFLASSRGPLVFAGVVLFVPWLLYSFRSDTLGVLKLYTFSAVVPLALLGLVAGVLERRTR